MKKFIRASYSQGFTNNTNKWSGCEIGYEECLNTYLVTITYYLR